MRYKGGAWVVKLGGVSNPQPRVIEYVVYPPGE